MAENKLNTSSLPFGNFFINSYILPGFLFLLATILVCFVFRESLSDWTLFKSYEFNIMLEDGSLINLFVNDISVISELFIILIFLFMSIILGNGISVVSSFLFDTFWFGKGVGWPYERILSYYPSNYTNRAMNITIFTIANVVCIFYIFSSFSIEKLMLILFTLFIIKDIFIQSFYKNFYGSDKEIKDFLKLHIKNKKRSRLFETNWVFGVKLFKNSSKRKYKFWWFIYAIVLYAITGFVLDLSVFIWIFFGKFFGVTHGIDKYSRKKFKTKYEEQLDIGKAKNNTNIYWYTYIHLINSSPENIRIANSHLKRSILVRNLAGAGVLLFILLMTLKPQSANIDEEFGRWGYWIITLYLSSWLLFIGYNHIFHKYYTKYVIRSFIVSKK